MSNIVVYDQAHADVPGKVTSYVKSVNTPDYDGETNKLVNPDLSALAGVPVAYWKHSAGSIVEMTDTEKGEPLAAYKQNRYNEIDLKTGALIIAGFTYDSKTFSLSINAQTNWNTLKDQESEFTWPVDVTTIDNDTYSLVQANLGAFWTAGKDAVKGHLDSGRTLKKSVFDAADKVAIDAVVDTR